MIVRPFDELQVGDRLMSPGRTITETDLVMFCYFTGNWEGLHADEEFARKTQYGRRIASGRMLVALVSGLLRPASDVDLAMYGINKVRFTKPVRVGDTIRYESVVREKRHRDNSYGIVHVEIRAMNQHDELLMMSEELVLVGRQRIITPSGRESGR